MRKALLPTLASLLICGAAAGAAINAYAGQTTGKPVLMLAQNQPAPQAAREAGPPPDMDEATREPRRGQFCRNISALKAGELAFLETKLQLTGSQQPLFARWKDISMDIAKRREGGCESRVERQRAGRDLMERLDREEDRLKTRLADIQAERPSLSALYAALDPTQKEEFGRAARVGGRMHVMGMMRHAPEMGRRFGRGPAGEPPLPAPPPAQ
jgi:hypothetical protein